MPSAPAEVGSSANTYEVLAKLATGGMAEIFLARAASGAGVERYVVLKRVLRNRASDAHFVRMFLDEARLAAQLQHPNIAQVYDLGKLGDSYFFTMEYVHGGTARALMNRSRAVQQPIPLAAVLTIAAGAAAGLHHAHERHDTSGRALQIVHRDVSPSNLMISYEGTVKLVDFGIAKAAHRDHETESGVVKGKIAYFSPEQCLASPAIDRRSDLYSLGIVMWELLTLKQLHGRRSDLDQMRATISEAPPAPSQLRPAIPAELDAIVLKLLAKDPAARFQTADELHSAIEEIAVKLGSALSSASLGRFVRDLFGPSPEPWVRLHAQAAPVAALMMNSEPIPDELAIPVAEVGDPRLAEVIDLSEAAISIDDLSIERTSSRSIAPREGRPTVRLRTGEPFAPSESRPSEPAARASTTVIAKGPLRSRWLPAVVLAAALALGIGLAIANQSPGSAVHAAPLDAGPKLASIAAPVAVDAAVGAEVAAVVAADSGAAPAAPADPADPIDAMPEPPAPPAPPPDPAVLPPRLARPPPHTSPGDELATAYAAGRFAAAAATCSANPGIVARNPTACVLAACHFHDAARARTWVKSAGGKRATLVAQCAVLGTAIDEVHDCARDPMACQH